MEHEEVLTLMMDALDGELAESGRLDLEAHLRACPSCAQEWIALRTVDGLLLNARVLLPPADFAQRTLALLPNPAYRLWVISALYVVLLMGGVLPLVGIGLIAGVLGPTLFEPAFLSTLWQALAGWLADIQLFVSAVFNGLGAYLAQQPALVGALLVMVGVVLLWGGVYTRLVSPRLSPQRVTAG